MRRRVVPLRFGFIGVVNRGQKAIVDGVLIDDSLKVRTMRTGAHHAHMRTPHNTHATQLRTPHNCARHTNPKP